MRPQAYRPERPTPFEALVALVGLVVVAAIVVAAAWLGLVALFTWGEAVQSLRQGAP